MKKIIYAVGCYVDGQEYVYNIFDKLQTAIDNYEDIVEERKEYMEKICPKDCVTITEEGRSWEQICETEIIGMPKTSLHKVWNSISIEEIKLDIQNKEELSKLLKGEKPIYRLHFYGSEFDYNKLYINSDLANKEFHNKIYEYYDEKLTDKRDVTKEDIQNLNKKHYSFYNREQLYIGDFEKKILNVDNRTGKIKPLKIDKEIKTRIEAKQIIESIKKHFRIN